jgi:hypothetical protein
LMKIMAGAVRLRDSVHFPSRADGPLTRSRLSPGTGEEAELRGAGVEGARPGAAARLAPQRDAQQREREGAFRRGRCVRREFSRTRLEPVRETARD